VVAMRKQTDNTKTKIKPIQTRKVLT